LHSQRPVEGKATLYSTSRGYLDIILSDCGCDLESFHTYRDAVWRWNARNPGEQLVELVEAVKKDQADLGLRPMEIVIVLALSMNKATS